MKKVLIQNNEQLELVREEIHVSSLFNHPNLLPLLDHAIIAVKVITQVLPFQIIVDRFLIKLMLCLSLIHLSLLDGHILSICIMVGKLLRVEHSLGNKSDF